MSAKKPTGQDKKVTTIDVNDPDSSKGALKTVGGSRSDHWNNNLLNQAANTLWIKHSDEKTRETQCKATMSALVGIAPKDEIEGMIAAQVIAAHNAAMECYRRAMHSGQTFEGAAREPEPGQQAVPQFCRAARCPESASRQGPAEGYGGACPRPFRRAGCGGCSGAPRQYTEIRGPTQCETNCPCTSARDAERELGRGTRANRQRCRTAGVGCTGASHRGPRRGIKMPSNMDVIPQRLCCDADTLRLFCEP